MRAKINHYVAYAEYKSNLYAQFQGYASSKEEFISMCEDADFDLDGLEIVEEHRNIKDEMGHAFAKRVWAD